MAEEFENPEMMIEEELKESWADENLDEHIKAIITDYENGSGIEIDIVSHLEYFYNTLDCDFHTKNPFDSPTSYPALLYKEPMQRSQSIGESSNSQQTLQEKTLFEKHRALIFPNSNSVKSKSKSSMSGGGTGKSASSSDISPAGKAFLNVQN